LIIESIDLIGNIYVQGKGNLALLLDTDVTYLTGNTGSNAIGSHVNGSIFVAVVGSDTARITIDDANASGGSDGKLRVTSASGNLAAIGGNNGQSGGYITIAGGAVTALRYSASSYGAAIGGGNGSNGGVITITGGTITATGGSNSAAIGGGNGGSGGVITITGGTITATGSSGAAIGGGNNGSGATLTIGSAANIKAYSAGGRPAIHANGNNQGNGFYVNAMFYSSITSGSTSARLDVYADGDRTTLLHTLLMPTNYRCFAYSTGAAATQDYNVFAYNNTTGDMLGQALQRSGASQTGIIFSPVTNNDPIIFSVKSNEVLPVKLGPVPGIPSVTNITKNSTDFTSTGHNLNGVGSLVQGGFYYGTTNTTSAAGQLTPSTQILWTAQNMNSPKTEPVSALIPNTMYYMQTYLSVGSPLNDTYYSMVIPFVTLPNITTATVATGGTPDEVLINATFTGGLEPLTMVKIYYDTKPADPATSPFVTLAAADFTVTGFTN
jgi:hypothetical protein